MPLSSPIFEIFKKIFFTPARMLRKILPVLYVFSLFIPAVCTRSGFLHRPGRCDTVRYPGLLPCPGR